MIKRYRHLGATIFISTKYLSNTLDDETSTTKTYTSVVTGEPGSVVTFKVTTYNHSFGGASYTVDAVSKELNDTFTRTLDAGGSTSFVQKINVGTSTPGNGINVILTIMSTSIGQVELAANTTNINKVS